MALEPVCCKKQQKNVPDQLLVYGIGNLRRTLMIPNWFYKSPSDSPDHPESILYHLWFEILKGPLFYKSVTGQELFLQTGSSAYSLKQYEVKFKGTKDQEISKAKYQDLPYSKKPTKYYTLCNYSYFCLSMR